MALQNNPVRPSANAPYVDPYATNAPQAPAGNRPTAINTQDQYAGAQGAPTGAPMGVAGMASGVLGKLGIGSIFGAIGGGLLGFKVLLPRIALRLAPKVPPSMWLKFGVVGGSALAGAWLLGKLFGAKSAAAAQQP